LSQWRADTERDGHMLLLAENVAASVLIDEEGDTVAIVAMPADRHPEAFRRDVALMALAPELVDALLALTVWVRENASFADRPAGLLCEAHRVLNKSAGLS
jgi:hypothetical protein